LENKGTLGKLAFLVITEIDLLC